MTRHAERSGADAALHVGPREYTARMPSLLHEVLVELLREMPPALEALLQLPAHDAVVPVSESLGDAAVLYNEVTYALLPTGARKELKMLSPEFVQKLKHYEWQHPAIREFIAGEIAEGRARGLAEGLAEGHAAGHAEGVVETRIHAVLELLEVRGLAMTTAQREQIQAMRDAAQLERLFRAAVTAPSVDALLK